MNFKYDGTSQTALDEIIDEFKNVGDARGGFPTWLGINQASGDVWLVKGKPWREVCMLYQKS